MSSVPDRGCVVGCQRDVVEPNIDFVDDMPDKCIHFFQGSDLALEIAVMTGDVGRLYMD